MFGSKTKPKVRRRRVRAERVRAAGTKRARMFATVASWQALIVVLFLCGVIIVSLFGGATIDYAVGQTLDQPLYAKVDFQMPDKSGTAAAQKAARAATPSRYRLTPKSLTFDRIRADLLRLYQLAADSDTFEAYKKAVEAQGWPADEIAYERLRRLVDLPDDKGRAQMQEWVAQLPLESQYVVDPFTDERRDPKSTTNTILLEEPAADGQPALVPIKHSDLIPRKNASALRGSASHVARSVPALQLRETIEAIVEKVFRETPVITFDQEATVAAMREAEEAVPEVLTTFERGKPFIEPGTIGSKEYQLLLAHQAAYLAFISSGGPEAGQLRRERLLERLGLVTLATMLAIALVSYTWIHHPRIFMIQTRAIAFLGFTVVLLLISRLLDLRWPSVPELVFVPCIFGSAVLAIAYPRRFALGAICLISTMTAAVVRGDLPFLLTLYAGAVLTAFLLDEIRTRTKVISAGVVTAAVVVVTWMAGGLFEGQQLDFVLQRAQWAGGASLMSFFLVSGLLPFIERTFGIATSLTLLEWRDPTRPLLQILAQEAPGTYNHSLVLGTLAEAACERIGANGLLAQVGALYHDIGKIHKADYFTENQEGRRSRHENLAPTMSLLVILGHVKDGIEMAKEYKLPAVLRRFIAEHHGTTVVRYFHHMASEKQPELASGRHDREVPEAEFRYPGPKPRLRETAVLMICDAVEGAVRSLHEPTVGRIENVVHSIVLDRLNDGQFDDCDITLKEVHLVEESVVKSLCSIYHGRVAYPKAASSKDKDEPKEPAREETPAPARLSG